MKGAIAKAEELKESTPGAVDLRTVREPGKSGGTQGNHRTGDLGSRQTVRVDIFVAGVGTGGTVTGVGEYLKGEESERQDRCGRAGNQPGII